MHVIDASTAGKGLMAHSDLCGCWMAGPAAGFAGCMVQRPSAITFSAALDEETISHLHDVCLVHCCHLVSSILMSVLKGILSYTSTGNPGDDLQHKRIYQTNSADIKHAAQHEQIY